MSTCLVTAADYRVHFQTPTCPDCGYTSSEPDDFAVWFCPSTPDRCDGCEVDPRRAVCPECGCQWEREQ